MWSGGKDGGRWRRMEWYEIESRKVKRTRSKERIATGLLYLLFFLALQIIFAVSLLWIDNLVSTLF
jgi:hypothetical protein